MAETATPFLGARDALGSTAPLPFDATFPFLGLPLRVRSNAQAAIDLATESFGVWRALDPSLIDSSDTATIELRVIVHVAARPLDDRDDDASAIGADRVIYRRHGPMLVSASTSGSLLAGLDLDQRLCAAFVHPSTFDRPDWYQSHVHGLARFAASALDRHPFHAATILAGDTAILLTGATGSGKSTLAYACVRQHLRLLAEEVTHIATRGGLRLWGHTPHVTLAPDTVRFFPEVAAAPDRLLPSGKHKREYPLDAAPPLTHAGRTILCVLTDHTARTTISAPLSEEERRDLLAIEPEPGFDQFPDSYARIQHVLAQLPAWRLSMGPDLDAAAAHLARLTDDGRASAM
jgi:hypothetical protein